MSFFFYLSSLDRSISIRTVLFIYIFLLWRVLDDNNCFQHMNSSFTSKPAWYLGNPARKKYRNEDVTLNPNPTKSPSPGFKKQRSVATLETSIDVSFYPDNEIVSRVTSKSLLVSNITSEHTIYQTTTDTA